MKQATFRVMMTAAVWSLLTPTGRADDVGDYLPAHVDSVVTLNFARLVESPLAKQYLPELVKKYGFEFFRELAAETGVKKKAFDDNEENIRKILSDPAETRRWLDAYGRAVQRVTVGVKSDSSGKPDIALFEGNWDSKLLDGLLTFSSLAAPDDLKVVKDGKRKYFQLLPKGGAAPVAAILSDELAVMTPTRDGLFRAMDVYEGKKVGDKASKELRDMLRKLDPDAVGSFCFYDAGKQFGVTASVFLDKEIRFSARATAPDEAGAKLLVEDIKGAVRRLREDVGRAAKVNASFGGVFEALDNIVVERIETEVRVDGRIPTEVIHRVMKQLLGAE